MTASGGCEGGTDGGSIGGPCKRMPQSVQSVPNAQSTAVAFRPPSSHSPLLPCTQLSLQATQAGGGCSGEGGTDGGLWMRMPQSEQSVPNAQTSEIEPSPPSSHSPLTLCGQSSVHDSPSGDNGGSCGGGDDGGLRVRVPQSVQSVPNAQTAAVASSPPSSHSPLSRYSHTSLQSSLSGGGCAGNAEGGGEGKGDGGGEGSAEGGGAGGADGGNA